MRLLVAAVLALLPLAHGAAQQPTALEAPLGDARKEAAALALMRELRCLQCQNESIAESNAPQAEMMRRMVRERIAAGEDPKTVRDWFIERYGDWVTFMPPPGPETALLWATPVVLLGLGGLAALRLFRR